MATDEQNQPYQPEELKMAFDAACSSARKKLRTLDQLVMVLKAHGVFNDQPVPMRNPNEMQANLMLAHRHLEDAIMRLGKAIQAYDGGVSVYEK